jgi:hypothetical protein
MNSDVSFDKNDIENSFYSSGSENMDENLITCNNIFNLNHYFDNDVDNQKLEDQDLDCSSKIVEDEENNTSKNQLDKTQYVININHEKHQEENVSSNQIMGDTTNFTSFNKTGSVSKLIDST